MKAAWLQECKTAKDKEILKGKIIASREVFEREKEIVESWKEKEQGKVISEDSFDCPNWSHKQAYINGKLKAYKEMLDLLDFL